MVFTLADADPDLSEHATPLILAALDGEDAQATELDAADAPTATDDAAVRIGAYLTSTESAGSEVSVSGRRCR
jgi:hypothetical protein